MKLGKPLLFLAMFAFWAGVLEIGSRWWLRSMGNPVDRVIHALRPDNELLWRQRSNQSLTLWGKSMRLNEFGFRQDDPWSFADSEGLLMLGPSSAVGWGVEAEETYSALLAQDLSAKGKTWKTLNASEIGFSSRQGLALIQKPEISRLNPKLVLISYGVNDLDRYRFFGDNRLTDEETIRLRRENPLTAKDIIPYESSLFYLLTRLTGELQASSGCGLNYVPKLRALSSEFVSNMITIANFWKTRGAEPVLLTTPLLVKNAAGDPEASTRLYTESAKEAGAKHCAEARDLFQRARAEETARVARDNAVQNELLILEAKKAGLRVVPIHQSLLNADDFVDPVHPSAAGHRKIATRVLESLVARP